MYVTCVFKSNLLYIFELWSSLLESSTKISKFYAITYYEHIFHKAGIKNLLPIWFKLGFPWLEFSRLELAVIITDWEPTEWVPLLKTYISTNNGGESKKNYISIHKVLEHPWRHFTSPKLCKCSHIPQPSPRALSISNRNALNYAT